MWCTYKNGNNIEIYKIKHQTSVFTCPVVNTVKFDVYVSRLLIMYTLAHIVYIVSFFNQNTIILYILLLFLMKNPFLYLYMF